MNSALLPSTGGGRKSGGDMSSANELPLREKFTNAERLTRELIDHLEQGFLPKIQQLRRVCRKDEEDGVTDKSVRHQCLQLIGSDEFTEKLSGELRELLDGISKEMDPMIYGENI